MLLFNSLSNRAKYSIALCCLASKCEDYRACEEQWDLTPLFTLRKAFCSCSIPPSSAFLCVSASLRENASLLSHHSSLLPDFGPWTSDAGLPPTIHHITYHSPFSARPSSLFHVFARYKLFLSLRLRISLSPLRPLPASLLSACQRRFRLNFQYSICPLHLLWLLQTKERKIAILGAVSTLLTDGGRRGGC